MSPNSDKILNDMTKTVKAYIASHPKEYLESIIAGETMQEFLEKNMDEMIKDLLPETFLITIELPGPKDASLAFAANIVEKHLPGATVVHIEKKEKLS